MSARLRQFQAHSSAAQVDSAVISELHNQQAMVRSLYALIGNIADVIKILPAKRMGRTTVKTTAAYNATALSLVGDASVNNYLNGVVVTTSDFILYNTQIKGWRLLQVASVGAVAATITVATITGCDGLSALGSASGDGVVAGHPAYVVRAGDVVSITPGATGIYQLYDIAASDPSCPIAISHLGGSASAHASAGMVEYMPCG